MSVSSATDRTEQQTGVTAGARVPVNVLKQLDGLSVKDARRLPHPADLLSLSDAGLYHIDLDVGVFRLTDAGRVALVGLEAR